MAELFLVFQGMAEGLVRDYQHVIASVFGGDVHASDRQSMSFEGDGDELLQVLGPGTLPEGVDSGLVIRRLGHDDEAHTFSAMIEDFETALRI